ncbi:retroviral-like aspartic protease family protein [candidate division KSB1 bacterium]|nr:retroviral-like aspartic protease family protein [candidate division KSB1 bacterium]
MFRANRISGWLDYGGVLLVPANLNGTRLNFLVDSGAANTAVKRQALDKITAEPTEIKRSIAPVGQKTVTVSTLKADDLVVGSVVQKNLMVSIIDFPSGFQFDGILGMDFMGKYRITIETDTATLVLREIPKKK